MNIIIVIHTIASIRIQKWFKIIKEKRRLVILWKIAEYYMKKNIIL